MVRPNFRLLKAELNYARLVHHERFLNDCRQRNIIPCGFRSKLTPCLSDVPSDFRNAWNSIQSQSALSLLDITRNELRSLKHDSSSKMEFITNSIIDEIGIFEYQIRKDVDSKIVKYTQSLIRHERGELLKFTRNPLMTVYHETCNGLSNSSEDSI